MTTRTMHTAGHPILGELVNTVSRALAAIATGARAADDWRRMNALSDAALARQGITREQIARAVLERNFR